MKNKNCTYMNANKSNCRGETYKEISEIGIYINKNNKQVKLTYDS